jgi:hypothetical protein
LVTGSKADEAVAGGAGPVPPTSSPPELVDVVCGLALPDDALLPLGFSVPAPEEAVLQMGR